MASAVQACRNIHAIEEFLAHPNTFYLTLASGNKLEINQLTQDTAPNTMLISATNKIQIRCLKDQQDEMKVFLDLIQAPKNHFVHMPSDIEAMHRILDIHTKLPRGAIVPAVDDSSARRGPIALRLLPNELLRCLEYSEPNDSGIGSEEGGVSQKVIRRKSPGELYNENQEKLTQFEKRKADFENAAYELRTFIKIFESEIAQQELALITTIPELSQNPLDYLANPKLYEKPKSDLSSLQILTDVNENSLRELQQKLQRKKTLLERATELLPRFSLREGALPPEISLHESIQIKYEQANHLINRHKDLLAVEFPMPREKKTELQQTLQAKQTTAEEALETLCTRLSSWKEDPSSTYLSWDPSSQSIVLESVSVVQRAFKKTPSSKPVLIMNHTSPNTTHVLQVKEESKQDIEFLIKALAPMHSSANPSPAERRLTELKTNIYTQLLRLSTPQKKK
jgi:hypothetical protein